MKTIDTALDPGNMQFYDNTIPSLHAGHYVITSTVTLTNQQQENYPVAPVSQSFDVSGPQFSLPGTAVSAVFPADNTNGNFAENLPYILLQQASLPWDRELVAGDTQTPWMALVILQGNEVQLNPATNSPLISSTVAEFFNPQPHVLKPDIPYTSLPQAVLQSQMNSIRITAETFSAVLPRLQEVSSLTHVRRINPDSQEVSGSPDDEWFSVIIANRFPYAGPSEQTSGAVNYAHLVSLEGLVPYLVDQPSWGDNVEVQLVSLASWSFITVPQTGQTFADLAENLVQQEGNNPQSLLLSIPITPDGSTAATRITQGYTALSYHTLTPNDTFAWYRGPFTPVVPQPLPASITRYQDVSQAMIYDQANAIFDHSYAAAWTIGRLTALADPVFVSEAHKINTGTTLISNRMLTNSKKPHLAHISDLKTLAGQGLSRKAFIENVRNGMHTDVQQLLTNPLPVSSGKKKKLQKINVNYFFKGEIPPVLPSAEAKWFRSKTEVRSVLKENIGESGSGLSDWLSKLVLLYNIPFNHLVPDQRMLPAESARFFYVDQNWLRVLYDGALSVTLNSERDIDNTLLMQEALWNPSLKKVPGHRSKLLRKNTATAEDLPALPAAGMLLRSALVSGWPGLAVNATAGGNAVNILRIDRVSPNVLLVLWDQVPDTVTISEPQQGIAFGVEDGWIVPLRNLAAANPGAQLSGVNFPATGTVQNYMRPVSGNKVGGVLQLVPPQGGNGNSYLVSAMTAQLKTISSQQPVVGNLLTPSQWAIEMVKAPQMIVFNPLP